VAEKDAQLMGNVILKENASCLVGAVCAANNEPDHDRENTNIQMAACCTDVGAAADHCRDVTVGQYGGCSWLHDRRRDR